MMKLLNPHVCFLMLTVLVLVLAAMPLTAQVYRVVDEDGNVTYTDQPPGDGSKPIKLQPISVIETPKYETKPKPKAEGEDGEPLSLRSLRRMYRDFAIVAPQSEESIWHPEAPITVAWSTGSQLQDGMTVSVSIDGKLQTSTTDRVIPVGNLDRGEHTVTAELTNERNQKVATAEPIVFFIRRPNLDHNRPRPAPRGGG
ncbi:MAG: DUF4124 domain-containing protein [Xanthomonadales bacterium]|nr:DUF4124 domain-containing protein [Xanthomonadales bacterium]